MFNSGVIEHILTKFNYGTIMDYKIVLNYLWHGIEFECNGMSTLCTSISQILPRSNQNTNPSIIVIKKCNILLQKIIDCPKDHVYFDFEYIANRGINDAVDPRYGFGKLIEKLIWPDSTETDDSSRWNSFYEFYCKNSKWNVSFIELIKNIQIIYNYACSEKSDNYCRIRWPDNTYAYLDRYYFTQGCEYASSDSIEMCWELIKIILFL